MVIWKEHGDNSAGLRNAVYEAVTVGEKLYGSCQMEGSRIVIQRGCTVSRISVAYREVYERQVRMQNE